ncbi:uncharacterized protein LOC126377050 isoform X2 [Pectinophora gossypiella]|uniref:uncharacterized protein LOC126377050 isoform X2 n=2 Tax=Pectinophora gossypiella TaxID=13191 RepID=UPI00214E84AF|nr:uncharacterized protein LOC126377050 isoform X2 [Pectinophora gossypiella]
MTSAVVAQPDLDPPYCALRYRRLCQGKGRHIACQFPSAGPGETCVNYTSIKFTKQLRHFVTHYINRRRQRVAAGSERVRGGVHLPRPELMMQVEWDRELAVLAQRLADQCSFIHDDCRATVRYPYAGQNVGEVKWRRSSESDQQNAARAIRRVFDAWWGERRRVTVRQLVQPFRLTSRGSVWGHFSQLAVWTLRAVGCGAVRHGSRYPRILLVCDFSHTNMLGQRTLTPGPLAPCPIHTTRRPHSSYPMLCAQVRHPATKEPAPHNPKDYEPSDYDPYYLGEEEDEADEDYYVTYAVINTTTTISSTTELKDTTYERPLETVTVREHYETEKEATVPRQTTQERLPVYYEKVPSFERKPSFERVQMYERKPALDRIPTVLKITTREGKELNEGWSIETGISTVPTSQRSRFTFDVEDLEEALAKRKFEKMVYKALRSRYTTDGRFVKKLEMEMVKNKPDSQHPPSYHHQSRWRSTEAPYRPMWSKPAIEIPVEKEHHINALREEYLRTTAMSTMFYEPVRHRWRPTKDRPDRPGAKALLTYTVSYTPRHRAAKKEEYVTFPTFNMDKDIQEQFFRDTGFNPGWRQHKKI